MIVIGAMANAGRPKKAPDAARRMALGLRLTKEELSRLDAVVAKIPIASRHSIALVALRIGIEVLEEDLTKLIADVKKNEGRKTRGRPS